MASTIRAQLPPALLESVECRGLTCKIVLPTGADINALTGATGGLRRQIASRWPMWDHMFLVMRPEDETFGADLLKAIVKKLYEGPGLATCAAQYPETGELYARLTVLPKEDPENESNEARIIPMLHGDLAYGPLAACVGKELASIVDSVAIPEKVSGAVFESVGLWPASVQSRFRGLVMNPATVPTGR